MATNLPEQKTQTQTFFNGYFNQDVTMDPDVYNQVYSFFKSRTSSTVAANQLTQTVMILTYNNKLDPLIVINDFAKAANTSEFKTLLMTFFNSLRGPTSKIGYANNVNRNEWIERNILA